MKKTALYLAAAICLALAYSCKEDEETTTKYSLTGLSINGSVAFVGVGDYQNISVDTDYISTTGSQMPDAIGISWQVNSSDKEILSENISTNPVTALPPYKVDSLGSYVIHCYAFAADNSQYSCEVSAKFEAIDPDTALTGLSGFVESGNKYREISHAGLTWTAENIYESTDAAKGLPYSGCEIMNSVFGRYYTYEEAMNACPSGWHLPTGAEWDALGTDAGKLMANARFLDTDLWSYSKEVRITNDYGFNAIPAGYIDLTAINTPNAGEKEYAAFWTADAKDSDLAFYRFIFGTNPVVQTMEGSRTSLALSVRCVKN